MQARYEQGRPARAGEIEVGDSMRDFDVRYRVRPSRTAWVWVAAGVSLGVGFGLLAAGNFSLFDERTYSGTGFATLGAGLLAGAIGAQVYLSDRTVVRFSCPSCEPLDVQFPVDEGRIRLEARGSSADP